MKYIFAFLPLLLFTHCGNYERVYISDIDNLINKKKIANLELIEIAERRSKRYGYYGDVIIGMRKMHGHCSPFIDSIDGFKEKLKPKLEQFLKRTNKYFTDYPSEYLFENVKSPTLVKLQLTEMENMLLRASLGGICGRYDRVEVAIIPEKYSFIKDEMITGKIVSFAYYSRSNAKVKLNGDSLKLVDGIARFSIDPKKLNPERKGQFELDAEVILGDTTLYNRTQVLIRN